MARREVSVQVPQGLTPAQAYELATSLRRQGRWQEAEELCRALLKAVPDHFGGLSCLGAICLSQGKLEEAAQAFRQALAIEPGSGEAHNNMGVALAALKRHDEAVAEYQKVLELEPNNVGALNNYGLVLLLLQRPLDAMATFDRAIALRPEAAEGYNFRGNALAALDRNDEALANYDRALAIKPAFAEAWNNSGVTLSILNRRDDARARFERALAIRPGFAEAHGNLGRELAALGQFELAVTHLRKALGARPDAAELHNTLGSALAALQRTQEAIGHYQRAIQIRPDLAEAHNNLGIAFGAMERQEDAIACFQKAIALSPNLADAHNNLGHAWKTSGRLEEARREMEKAIELRPDRPEFYRSITETKRFTADDPHLAAMEALDKQPLGEQERIALHFGLGKAYGDLERHEEAFRHLLEGNRLKRLQIDYDEAATLGLFPRTSSFFTAELLQARSGVGEPSSLPVLIVGMPRSGSTLIEQILASHPKVYGAGEIGAFRAARATLLGPDARPIPFPEGIASVRNEQIRRVGAHYLQRVKVLAPAAERITDKSLMNFLYLGFIRLALPGARIIHSCRNPVDTCLSCFSKLFTNEQHYTYDLAELGRYYRAYQALMEHWRRVLPEGVMLEVQYEELVADFEPQARRIVEHCGLEWDARCHDFHQTERVVKTASATQVRQPLYTSSVGRWRPYQSQLKPLFDALGIE